MHAEWTDKLSDYLDDELTPAERRAVEAHLSGCAECARTLDELGRVVERARELRPRPPAADLWGGVADRLAADRAPARTFVPKRIAFTMPQLAAAAVLIAAVSGALAFVGGRSEGRRDGTPRAAVHADATPQPPAGPVDIVPVTVADAQYDAAVADLERALKNGRGKLDASTVAALEQSLQTIDQAIDQARQALAGDPANTYLSGYLFETRRRKLDLLRRATALTETD